MYSKVHDIHDNKYVSRTIDHKITHMHKKNTDLQQRNRHSPETEASALMYVVVRACHRAYLKKTSRSQWYIEDHASIDLNQRCTADRG
jgi:hypothetical protein